MYRHQALRVRCNGWHQCSQKSRSLFVESNRITQIAAALRRFTTDIRMVGIIRPVEAVPFPKYLQTVAETVLHLGDVFSVQLGAATFEVGCATLVLRTQIVPYH